MLNDAESLKYVELSEESGVRTTVETSAEIFRGSQAYRGADFLAIEEPLEIQLAYGGSPIPCRVNSPPASTLLSPGAIWGHYTKRQKSYASAPGLSVANFQPMAFLRVYFPFSVRAPNDAALLRPGFRYPETSVHTLLQFLRIPCPPGFHSDREFGISR
jgi:hypothetical protein